MACVKVGIGRLKFVLVPMKVFSMHLYLGGPNLFGTEQILDGSYTIEPV